MKKIFILVAVLFIVQFSKAQLTMTYSFSSIDGMTGFGNANLIAPMILSGASECYTLESGLPKLYGERKDGVFMVNCTVSGTDNLYGFGLFPNPATSVITFRTKQKMPSGYYAVNIIGMDGIIYYSARVSADDIYSGVTLDISNYAAAGYVFFLNGNNIEENYLFVKASY